MKKYEVLDHISDLKIKVFGRNLKELFTNAMIAMFKAARYKPWDNSQERKKIKRKLKISSIDLPFLLVDFLSEVLYLSEAHQEVYYQIQFKEMTNREVEATLIGQRLERKGVVIKGVTYHNLNVCLNKDKMWEATILFDI
ncbi:archease [bacterium]|nr:archease [bacterium]